MTDETAKKPKLELISEDTEVAPIEKPGEFDLNAFKSNSELKGAVETLQGALPHHNLAEARDWVRLHPDESKYWSSEYCFVTVPIVGQKRDTLHLIVRPLALLLPSGRVSYFRLVLASKPNNVFFLCHVPTRNRDNTWVSTNLQACEQAKTLWTQAVSQKEEGIEAYKVEKARDADVFPEPDWPAQSLDELVFRTFTGRMISERNHVGFSRLIGEKPIVS
jgi:hypothetical protein